MRSMCDVTNPAFGGLTCDRDTHVVLDPVEGETYTHESWHHDPTHDKFWRVSPDATLVFCVTSFMQLDEGTLDIGVIR